MRSQVILAELWILMTGCSIQWYSVQELDSQWDPHTVDRFADWCNNQTPRFNSRYYCPGAEAIDAFTCDWGCDNNWWCTPLYLIPRILRHAKLTKAKGALIIPKWVSAPLWPLLFPDGVHKASFVSHARELPRVESLFVHGRSGASLFKGVPNTPVGLFWPIHLVM